MPKLWGMERPDAIVLDRKLKAIQCELDELALTVGKPYGTKAADEMIAAARRIQALRFRLEADYLSHTTDKELIVNAAE